MVYETSYGTGQKPFIPDLHRGTWEKPSDYLFACFGLAFKLDIFVATDLGYFDIGIIGILPYYLYMVIYLVPILVIHSFMGQFSSSSYISAFRLSPFFKGMGYVSCCLSTGVVIYYGIFAAVPILYMVNSLRPTLPWSCEGLKSWYNESEKEATVCNISLAKTKSYEVNNVTYYYRLHYIPSVLFFQDHYKSMNESSLVYNDLEQEYELSYHIVIYFVVVWVLIALIFYKFSEVAKFGRFIRFMVTGTLGLAVVCFVRLIFLPGALTGLLTYVAPKNPVGELFMGFSSTFIMVLQAFGAGWGSVIALSSFNRFKTNIMSYSWIAAFGQVLIYILFGIISRIIKKLHTEVLGESYKTYFPSYWLLFLSSASAMVEMHWANLWTIIYYMMYLMASLIVMTTQIFTILQTLFDEFESLRLKRQELTFGFIGGLAVCSFFFCTNHGIIYFDTLTMDAIVLHNVLHLLLLLVILWIYGRVRFQRDIKFMLGQPFANWKVFILRFISPFILLISLIYGTSIALREHSYTSTLVSAVTFMIVLVPLLAIPCYGFYYLYQNTGTFSERFRRACRPTDWYPVEMEHRQQYELSVGSTEMTHQLFEFTEAVN
ncbi:sodium- and chloride-dependent glycine transporter 1-like isoform X2 [Drosophila bipectinata]|uniref:sodium- and chloride-dependent glycine transporter 1-like isoform X2 n=1 Tax=Drosophila bipectinata TaxID=42026 RepID=UPI0038B32FC8